MTDNRNLKEYLYDILSKQEIGRGTHYRLGKSLISDERKLSCIVLFVAKVRRWLVMSEKLPGIYREL